MLSYLGYSQSIFYKTYGGNGYDTGNDVIQIAGDSSFYIAGSSSSASDAPSQALLLHIDKFGEFISSHFYGGPRSDIGVRVMHKPGVGFWIAGYSNSFSDDANFDFYLIKLNEQYEKQWEKTYGSANWERLHDAILLPDEGVVLVGEVEGIGHAGKDAYAVRTDDEGNLIWEQTFVGALNDVAYCAELFDNNSFLIAGVWGVEQSNAWLSRLDLDGNIIWSRNDYLTDRTGEIRAVKIYDNRIYFYGNWSPFPFVEENKRKYQGVAELSNILINNVFENGTNETHVSMTKLRDARFYGVSKENNPAVVGDSGPRAAIFGNEGGGYFIGFSHEVHGNPVIPGKIISSLDTCLVLVGSIQDPSYSTGGSNVMLLKITDETISQEDITSHTILSLDSFDETEFSIYPNPTNDFVQVTLPMGVVGTHYNIFNIHGKQMKSGSFIDFIDLASLQNGIYFLSIKTNIGIKHLRIQKL